MKAIRQRTVVEQVMEEVQALIASGKYKVNDQIPGEIELAEMFGVSRPSVREAIKIFKYLGVLKSQTGSGTYLSDQSSISTEALTWAILLGQNEVQEMIELREVLEYRSIEKIVTAMESPSSTEIIQELNKCLSDMKEASGRGSLKELSLLDFEFHRIILSGSENSLFSAIYRTLRSFMMIEIEQTHSQIVDLDIVEDAHRRILDGILTGDVQTALNAFRAHMQSRCFQVFNRI